MQQTENAHSSVKVFVIRLLAIVSHNEAQFIKIFETKGEKISKEFATLGISKTLASVKVAYLELAHALTAHNSGYKWLIQNGILESIYTVCSKDQTVFVLRQTFKFITELLWKLSDEQDKSRLSDALELILNPIIKSSCFEMSSLTEEEENDFIKNIEPALHIIMSALNKTEKVQQKNILVESLFNIFHLPNHFCKITNIIHREDIMFLLGKLKFQLAFAKMFLNTPIDGKFERNDFLELTVTYFNTLRMYIERRQIVPLIDYCNICCIIWSENWSRSAGPTFERNGRSFELQSQLLFILLVPVLVYIKNNRCYNRLDHDDPINQYLMKLVNSSCEHTTRAAYSIKHLMYECDPLMTTLHCVKRLSCLQNHLNNAGANLIFQALFYVLNEYVPKEEELEQDMENGDYDEGSEKMSVMIYVVDTIYRLVKNHDINWHESIETICLYNQIHLILNRRNLSCKVNIYL